MFKRLGRFVVLAVCLFALAMVGCGNGEDEDDLLEFVSVDPPDGSTIQPDATVTVTFNRAIEPDDSVYSFMGRDPDGDSTETGDRVITGNTMTITRGGAHPFDAGYLKVEIQWYGGRVTLNYTVEDPMKKLIGVYELAELVVEMDGDSVTLHPPTVYGSLGLFSDNTFRLFTVGAEGNIQNFEGPWIADGTHITLDGDRSQYSWDGTHLTISSVSGGTKVRFKWRKS